MCFVKGIVRTGVIVALAGGATALVAETASPGSVSALFGQAKGAVAGAIACAVDDPVALRAQLKSLEGQYPARIAEVRSDLAEVSTQIDQLERELAISEKVVSLTAHDLALLDNGIEQARAATAASPHHVVMINFENRPLDVSRAYGRRGEIEQTQVVYQTKATEVRTELEFLADQREQLTTLLTQLETERAQFQAQVVQLDAQIDSIARNDRMIAMMEDRQSRIDELSDYETHSLEQFQRRVASMRGEQQARLAELGRDRKTQNYEDVARWELDRGGVTVIEPAAATSAAPVITIEPQASTEEAESLARLDD